MRVKDFDDGFVIIKCPGCRFEHVIAVDKPFSNGAMWSFNRNYSLPTFSPSLLVRSGKYVPDNDKWYADLDEEEKSHVDRYSSICHSFIIDGRIQYLSDCTHDMAGQTVDLPEYSKSDNL